MDVFDLWTSSKNRRGKHRRACEPCVTRLFTGEPGQLPPGPWRCSGLSPSTCHRCPSNPPSALVLCARLRDFSAQSVHRWSSRPRQAADASPQKSAGARPQAPLLAACFRMQIFSLLPPFPQFYLFHQFCLGTKLKSKSHLLSRVGLSQMEQEQFSGEEMGWGRVSLSWHLKARNSRFIKGH